MDNLKNWNKILSYIKDLVSPGNYRTWISKTKLGDITEERITLLVPHAFIKNQLTLRYEKLIAEAIRNTLGRDLAIEYRIEPSLLEENVPDQQADNEEDFFLTSPILTQPQSLSSLNPKYSLENFVVGLTNNLAYAAAQAVVQNPGITYNPLFIYGPSGVGKTHLMQAIGNNLLQKNSQLKLMYAPSETFMNDLVFSIQSKKTLEFRNKYRKVDLLLIDDIQFISGKDSTQEEFFHTFNELQSKNVQIVLTSDRPPNELPKLETRLSSRFQGGLMVDIQLPDFDTRVAILKAKLKERSEDLPEEFLRLIAENVVSNSRELEGKLIQIIQKSKLENQPLSLEWLKNQLGKSTQPFNGATLLDYKKVLAIIIQYFNIKMGDLIGPRRQKELVLPRQIAMFILYMDLRIPFEKIGQILGGRDHTTIMHGVDKMKQLSTNPGDIQRIIGEIKGQIS